MKLRWWHRVLLYLVSALLSGLSLLQVRQKIVGEGIAGGFYGVTALVLGLALWYLWQDLRFLAAKKLRPAIEGNRFTDRLTRDYSYRTVFFTCTSFGVNLIFAVSNGVYGLLHHSWWFGTLSAYYILLSIMRFGTLRVSNRDAGRERTPELLKREWEIYGRCGRLFLLLTVALVGAVILMVTKDSGKTYPDTLILAVAAYTFYKITVSVIHVIRARKIPSPLILTIRHIGYADALVSMLSLQTAMLTSFGGMDQINSHLMNGITGGAVCLMTMLMGLYMIRTSASEEKQAHR